MRYLFAMFLIFLMGCSTQPALRLTDEDEKALIAEVNEMDLHSNVIILDDCNMDNGAYPRVEIGNTPSWDTNTRREIQIPTYWSNEQITIMVNQGGFQDGETGYLFVVNSDGCVNSVGFPVVFGSEGVHPGQPLELRLSE